jgi:predicted XRE-type DNA-binding protein
MDSNQPPPVAEVDLPDLKLPPNDDIPEESADALSGSDDPHANLDSSSFDTPTRLASRFYSSTRPQVNRRKSSAASSRRNSLSSTHSVQSNSSYRAACRSNHVAQYLRRASIIEGRKARLAAREAHAEQVRLRAALARSTARVASNATEERALAARHAREKKLAEIAAACAEEVRRAKRIAEETKERRAAEEERNRQAMEEKMAESERRRLQYNSKRGTFTRRPRTASASPPIQIDALAPSKTSTKDLDANKENAVRRLQRIWRTRRRKQIFEAFAELDLGIEQVRESSFERMRAIMCDEQVLAIATRVLNLLDISTANEDGLDSHATRTFLTAYLILGHPNHVMDQSGDQEQDVIQKAKDLIISFEAVLAKASSQYQHDPPKTLVEALHIAYSGYVITFADWKARDKTMLIELLIQDFVNLDAIWQTVKDDTAGQVAEDYKHAIRENQVILLARLRKLAGPERAHQLIKRAIKESRRQKLVQRRKPVGALAKPRLAPDPAAASSAASSSSPNGSPQIAPASPTSSGSESRTISMFFSNIPPNRTLTHELVIDKDYRIDHAQQARLRDHLHRKICDEMRTAFENGEGDKWTVAVALNVRTKLLQLLASSRGQGSMYQLVSDALDPELISRQCVQGVFSYQNFFDFMANILPKLCAPVRDDDVRILAEELQRGGQDAASLEGMLDKLFKLFQMIDVLSLDYSNFLLSNVASRLIKEAPGYEQRLFAKDLDEGKTTLQRTQRWWNDASVCALTESASAGNAHPPTMQKIYARGLVDLAIATAPLKESDVPETLELDRERISQLREQSCHIAVIGALLLGAKNLLKRDVRAQWKTEATRMWELFKTAGARSGSSDSESDSLPVRLVSVIESSHALPPNTKSTLLATATRLMDQASSGRLTDPVAKVLFGRLKTHVYSRLAASSSGERVRAVSTASENLASAGLPEFVSAVGAMVDLLGKISDADRKSHGMWYEEMAVEPVGDNERLANVATA